MHMSLHQQAWSFKGVIMSLTTLLMRFAFLAGLLFQPLMPLYAEQTEPATPSLSIQSIHIATGVWPGFTDPSEQGAYIHLVKLLFPSETKFKVSYTSFNRSIQMVEQQQADMVLGIGLKDSPYLQHSALPFDIDEIAVLFKPSRLQINQPADLNHYQLVTQRGYNYDSVLGIVAQSYEVDSITTGVNLVRNGRVDAFLVEKTELLTKVDTQKLEDLQVVLLVGEPIYIGFANNERGALLKTWWDQQYLHYYQTGQLQAFYQQYAGMKLP